MGIADAVEFLGFRDDMSPGKLIADIIRAVPWGRGDRTTICKYSIKKPGSSRVTHCRATGAF